MRHRRTEMTERKPRAHTRSRRWRAGSRRNKRQKSVGTFNSDRRK